MFSCEFCKNFKNNFLTEQLRVTAYVKRLPWETNLPSYPPKPFNLPLYFKQTFQNKLLSKLFSNLIINHWISFPVVYCSKRHISFAWCRWHFNNIILVMQISIFLKIIILTFQSFNRREEKIKWTYLFPCHYDLYKEKVLFNNTDV